MTVKLGLAHFCEFGVACHILSKVTLPKGSDYVSLPGADQIQLDVMIRAWQRDGVRLFGSSSRYNDTLICFMSFHWDSCPCHNGSGNTSRKCLHSSLNLHKVRRNLLIIKVVDQYVAMKKRPIMDKLFLRSDDCPCSTWNMTNWMELVRLWFGQ